VCVALLGFVAHGELRLLVALCLCSESPPNPTESLPFGFWCDPEPSKSKDGCAHRNARCALDRWTSRAGAQHRCRGRRHVARVANVLKPVVQPIAECDQVVPAHLVSPSRAQCLNHFREPRPLIDHELASDALTSAITRRLSGWFSSSPLMPLVRPVARTLCVTRGCLCRVCQQPQRSVH
jgi:hypothetical protein